MDLGEGWVCKERASFVSAIRCGHIASARIRREIKHVAVSAAREHDRVRSVPLDFSRAQVSSDDSLRLSVDDHQIEHLCLRKHPHCAGGDLSAKRLITA